MKQIKIFLAVLMTALSASIFFSCKKSSSADANAGSTPFELRMTDAPATIYSAVNVDVIGVEVINSMGASVKLNIHPGIYNLLNLADGKDTIIATGDLPSINLEQVRLILGTDNTVLVDGVTYPLLTPSAEQSGLKLNVHAELLAGVLYRMLIDFDANQSIVQEGNGTYLLKPVIHVVAEATSGSIHGTIVSGLALPVTVTAVETGGSSETETTITGTGGTFLLRGLESGSYTVTIQPQPPLSIKVFTNVTVAVGVVTELGTINLQ